MWAVLKHRLRDKEIAAIRQADVPVMILHGRHDILALPKYGERLARRSVPRPPDSSQDAHDAAVPQS